jgi:hypothetical protein
MRVKEEFLSRGSFDIGTGMSTRFWEDMRLGDRPLAEQYPYLYNVVRSKYITIASTLALASLNTSFRHSLTGDRWDRWLHLVQRLMEIHLSEEDDIFRWRLVASGRFSVRSMYLDMLNGKYDLSNKIYMENESSIRD